MAAGGTTSFALDLGCASRAAGLWVNVAGGIARLDGLGAQTDFYPLPGGLVTTIDTNP